jgi:aldehyde:ferredoxin oxidoreductase
MCKIAVFMLLNDYGLEATAALAQAVAGLPLSSEQLLLAGERVATLERLFDVRCGIHADDDLLPRAFTVPLADGPHAGSAVDVTGMRDEFYRRMGWSPEGVPTASTLERLGLTAFSSGD